MRPRPLGAERAGGNDAFEGGRLCVRLRRRAGALAFAIALVARSSAAQATGAAATAAETAPPEVTLYDPSGAPNRDPELEPWRRRPFALELQSSLGGALGIVGAAFDWSVSGGFSLNGGVGIAASGAPQLGLIGRMRLPIASGLAAGLEGGLSGGDHAATESCESTPCPTWRWDPAVWGQLGLFVEGRSARGLTLRGAFGLTSIFNTVAGRCDNCEAGSIPRFWTTTLPYVAIAGGYAF